MTFQGRGYAYTNLSKKLAFASGGTVRYDQDFKMDGSTMYAHFRSKEVRAAAFNVIAIEQPLANLMNQIYPVADKFGKQLLDQKIAEGFTVIREPNGEADLLDGHPQRGAAAIFLRGARRREDCLREPAHRDQNERDFIGPIEVEDSGRALFVTAKVEGAGAMDVLLMAADAGAAALDAYLSQPNVGPMAPPVASEVLSPDAELRKTWPVPKGRYWTWSSTTRPTRERPTRRRTSSTTAQAS